EPEPSHTTSLQSPAVWPLTVGVEVARFEVSQRPALHARCSHSPAGAGQSRSAFVHSTHCPAPSQTLPPASLQAVSTAALSVAHMPLLHDAITHVVPLSGQSVDGSTHDFAELI